jgi:hypothetical protein
MAKIKVEGVVKQLDYEFKKAFTKTIKTQFPESEFDERELYKTFFENLVNECKRWETMPDDVIEKGDY